MYFVYKLSLNYHSFTASLKQNKNNRQTQGSSSGWM